MEGTEIKAFAPSTKLFKVFLFALLPLVLVALMALAILIFWGIMSMFWPEKTLSPKRYIVVSIICIIFLMHPSLTLEALSLFQCIEVDRGVYQMRSHMDYGCFSVGHVLWMTFLGLPMLAVWVVGMPLIALIIIVKNRHDLDDWRVKKYMLLLYQGLKPHAFYWEFVNIGKKMIVLCIITLLSQVPAYYQILLSLACIIIFLRVQMRLKPYKLELNNSIETLATSSSIATLFSLILLVEEDAPVGFKILVTTLMFLFNFLFAIKWLFLFMISWNIKNPNFLEFLKIYSIFIRQRSLIINMETVAECERPESKIRKRRKTLKKKKKALQSKQTRNNTKEGKKTRRIRSARKFKGRKKVRHLSIKNNFNISDEEAEF